MSIPLFDPDALKLTKHQIIGLVDKIISRMQKNKLENIIYIPTAMAAKALLRRTSDEKLAYYWKLFLSDIMEVQYENVRGEIPLLKDIPTSITIDLTKAIKH